MSTLILPYPPSANAMYRKTKRGVMLAPAVKKFRQEVAEYIEQIWPVGFEPVKGDLCVEVVLFQPPRQRRRDIDNPIKTLFDALTHAGVWEDDSQVVELCVRFGAEATGRAAVKILQAPPAALSSS